MTDRYRVRSLGHLRINDFEFVAGKTDGLDSCLRGLLLVDVEAVVRVTHTPELFPRFRRKLDLNVAAVFGILEAGSWDVADKVGIL